MDLRRWLYPGLIVLGVPACASKVQDDKAKQPAESVESLRSAPAVAPSGPFVTTLQIDVDEHGAMTGCTVLEYKAPNGAPRDPCAAMSTDAHGFVDKYGKPTKARIILKNSVEVQPR